MSDDNDFFLEAPVAVLSPPNLLNHIDPDQKTLDPLEQEFMIDAKLNSGHPQFIEMKDYLLSRPSPVSVADVRRVMKGRIYAGFLCDTIILRAMCELHNDGRGEVVAGSKTYRFQPRTKIGKKQ